MDRRDIRQMRIVHVQPLSGTTKFGMLRLTLGQLMAKSNACEVSMPSLWTGVVNSNNGDQEV